MPKHKVEAIEELGVYFVNDDINTDLIEPICKDLLLKKFQGFERNKVTLIINSQGGTLEDVLSLIDVLKFTRFEVEMVGMGIICSGALLLLMSGTPGSRKVTQDSILMSHTYTWGSDEAGYGDLVERRKIEDHVNSRYQKLYEKYTGLSLNVIKSKLLKATDTWLTPAEAKKFNIVDAIIGR